MSACRSLFLSLSLSPSFCCILLLVSANSQLTPQLARLHLPACTRRMREWAQPRLSVYAVCKVTQLKHPRALATPKHLLLPVIGVLALPQSTSTAQPTAVTLTAATPPLATFTTAPPAAANALRTRPVTPASKCAAATHAITRTSFTRTSLSPPPLPLLLPPVF